MYGVGNLYAYATHDALVASEGPSPAGIRTFVYNSTFLNLRDSDWCHIEEGTHLNLPEFWNNQVHSPTGKGTGQPCRGGNNTVSGPMADAEATAQATAILAPWPKTAEAAGGRGRP